MLTYSFTSTGGGITSNSTANATVVTDGLEPGVYDISSLVSDDHNRKHRLYATCQAAFSIKELPKHPPLMSLRVAPQAVTSGESVTVTAESYSKDNRPVHVNCVTTKGALSGGNNLYVLNTAGVPGGIVDITCTAQDDRDLSGFADAKVMVTVPPPPPPPQLVSMATVSSSDKTRGARRGSIMSPRTSRSLRGCVDGRSGSKGRGCRL